MIYSPYLIQEQPIIHQCLQSRRLIVGMRAAVAAGEIGAALHIELEDREGRWSTTLTAAAFWEVGLEKYGETCKSLTSFDSHDVRFGLNANGAVDSSASATAFSIGP